MKYDELIAKFHRANEEGRTIEGYITFTAQSFEQAYPLQARTYLVSSNNKRFKTGMTSNSIFASALDGSDDGVRLDLYMQNTGNAGGWVVEDCGLVSYQLLETCDRSPMVLGIYPNYTKAHHAMLDAINVALDGEVDKYVADEAAEINDFDSWANDAGKNHSNYDWNIFRLFNDGHSIRSEADMNEVKTANTKAIRGQREFSADDIIFDDEILVEADGLISFYLCVPEQAEEILGEAVHLGECDGQVNLMAFYDAKKGHITDSLVVTVIKDMADGNSEKTFLYELSTKEKELFEAKMKAYSYNGSTLADLCKEAMQAKQ